MTRQKKEIQNKINEIEISIRADAALGYVSADRINDAYDEIEMLEEMLARLMHYESRYEMYMDDRGFWLSKVD